MKKTILILFLVIIFKPVILPIINSTPAGKAAVNKIVLTTKHYYDKTKSFFLSSYNNLDEKTLNTKQKLEQKTLNVNNQPTDNSRKKTKIKKHRKHKKRKNRLFARKNK